MMNSTEQEDLARNIEKACLDSSMDISPLLEKVTLIIQNYPYILKACFGKACHVENKKAIIAIANCPSFKTSFYQGDITVGFKLLLESKKQETLKYFLTHVDIVPDEQLMKHAYLFKFSQGDIEGVKFLKPYLTSRINLNDSFIECYQRNHTQMLDYMLYECDLQLTNSLKSKIQQAFYYEPDKLKDCLLFFEKRELFKKINSDYICNRPGIVKKI